MVFAKILLIISTDTHLFAPNFDEGGISEDFTLKCLGHCLDGEPDTSTIGKGASQLNNLDGHCVEPLYLLTGPGSAAE